MCSLLCVLSHVFSFMCALPALSCCVHTYTPEVCVRICVLCYFLPSVHHRVVSMHTLQKRARACVCSLLCVTCIALLCPYIHSRSLPVHACAPSYFYNRFVIPRHFFPRFIVIISIYYLLLCRCDHLFCPGSSSVILALDSSYFCPGFIVILVLGPKKRI